ncbi:MAG: DUF2877 domain-containing protein [Syntrophorhabdaceae bacterium]|nr:DUF2877 domain-containing protein [Syntrophorhabdaceae bacterium]
MIESYDLSKNVVKFFLETPSRSDQLMSRKEDGTLILEKDALLSRESDRVADRGCRVETAFHTYLSTLAGYLGLVEWSKGTDVAITDKNGRPIYLQESTSLKTPFSLALDTGLLMTAGKELLCPGDRLHKVGKQIFRNRGGAWFFDFSSPTLLNLNHPLAVCPDTQTRYIMIDVLINEICSYGHFDGLAGLLTLLAGSLGHTRQGTGTPLVSPLGHYAENAARLAVRGAVKRNGALFRAGWDKLVGLGPGLTPAGDDLLVGFLASHRILCSPFWQTALLPEVRHRLEATLSATTRVSSALLGLALEGTFSEIIFDLFESFLFRPDEVTAQIRALLGIGHTSGSDLLTGITLGIMTA